MSIIVFSDFQREADIPNLFPEMGSEDTINVAIQNEVQSFIDRYEPDYLLQFLGDEKSVEELYEYFALPEEKKTDEQNNKLIKSLKTIIPNFIAFYWFRNETVQNTGIGAVLPQGQNSTRTNNVDRSVHIWNEMARASKILYRVYFLTYDVPNKDIFKLTNAFGI